jgi:hypothetical protein
MVDEIQVRPVIQAGPFELAVGDIETELSHEVELGLQSHAGPPDVARIGTDFRLDEHDVENFFFHNRILNKLFLTPALDSSLTRGTAPHYGVL